MWLDTLKDMKKRSGYTTSEIAERSEVPEATLVKLFSGATKDPRLETVRQLVHCFGYGLGALDDDPDKKNSPADDLSGEAIEMAIKFDALDERGKRVVNAVLECERQEQSKVVQFPTAKKRSDGFTEFRVYEQGAAAGWGNFVDDPTYHIEQYPGEMVPEKTDCGIIISGDSMEPEIHNGGMAFVHFCPEIQPGQIGIFNLNGESYCKRLARHDGQVRLVSTNKRYPDIIVKRSDVLITVGQVLGQWTRGYDSY